MPITKSYSSILPSYKMHAVELPQLFGAKYGEKRLIFQELALLLDESYRIGSLSPVTHCKMVGRILRKQGKIFGFVDFLSCTQLSRASFFIGYRCKGGSSAGSCGGIFNFG